MLDIPLPQRLVNAFKKLKEDYGGLEDETNP
ncbi:hypothetical protein [Thermotalea metallivorans]